MSAGRRRGGKAAFESLKESDVLAGLFLRSFSPFFPTIIRLAVAYLLKGPDCSVARGKKLNFPLCTSLTLSLSLCSLTYFGSSQRRTASFKPKRPKARCWSWTASTLSPTIASGWPRSPELVAESRASRYFAKPPKMVRIAKLVFAKVHCTAC